ncbi:MAG TPA: hypothetical protein VKZ79_16225 [Alphaproteobacteria bacterium]|nr:hypothetical protein [Alphaproteobacteria bacterium]
MAIRNRLLMCPLGEGLANSDGTIGERQIAYYGARAQGGVGLVVIGSAVVAYPRAAFVANMTAISDKKYLSGLAAMAARVLRIGECAGERFVAGAMRSAAAAASRLARSMG